MRNLEDNCFHSRFQSHVSTIGISTASEQFAQSTRRCCDYLVLRVAAQSSEHKQHFSTREGTIIRMHPLGASFEIPQHWTARTQESQLKQVRRGEGEWNTEYAKVVNAALPF